MPFNAIGPTVSAWLAELGVSQPHGRGPCASGPQRRLARRLRCRRASIGSRRACGLGNALAIQTGFLAKGRQWSTRSAGQSVCADELAPTLQFDQSESHIQRRCLLEGHGRGDPPLIGVEMRISEIADAYRAVLTCVSGQVGHYQLSFLRRKSLAKNARRNTAQFVDVGFLHCAGVSFDSVAHTGQVHFGSSPPHWVSFRLPASTIATAVFYRPAGG